MAGPYVAPGTYTVRLESGGRMQEQKVAVREDQRIDVTPADRRAWIDAQTQVVSLIRSYAPVNDRIQRLAGTANAADLKRQSRELLSRLGRLYAQIGRWVGTPTRDQLTQLTFYAEMAQKLTTAADQIR